MPAGFLPIAVNIFKTSQHGQPYVHGQPRVHSLWSTLDVVTWTPRADPADARFLVYSYVRYFLYTV